MKNLGLVVVTSLLSAFFAVFIYKTMFEEPQKILIKETLPAKQVEYKYPQEPVSRPAYASSSIASMVTS